MLQQMLVIKQSPIKYFDASDALAVAVCHHFQENALPDPVAAKAKSWKQFIGLHPSRIK
jgi:crossover junction endodeoxyribonuclease RuvC